MIACNVRVWLQYSKVTFQITAPSKQANLSVSLFTGGCCCCLSCVPLKFFIMHSICHDEMLCPCS